jgi:hypothetical protein
MSPASATRPLASTVTGFSPCGVVSEFFQTSLGSARSAASGRAFLLSCRVFVPDVRRICASLGVRFCFLRIFASSLMLRFDALAPTSTICPRLLFRLGEQLKRKSDASSDAVGMELDSTDRGHRRLPQIDRAGYQAGQKRVHPGSSLDRSVFWRAFDLLTCAHDTYNARSPVEPMDPLRDAFLLMPIQSP